MPMMPPLRVSFDDGTSVKIQPRARDLALAERDYQHDFDVSGTFANAYATALAALGRMKRSGEFDGELPESVSAFMDVADVEAPGDDDDAEGKDTDPVPTTG